MQTVSLVVTKAARWAGLAVFRTFELALWTIVAVFTSGRAEALSATLIADAGITVRGITKCPIITIITRMTLSR